MGDMMNLIKQRSFTRYFKTSYKEDMKIFSTVWSKFWLTFLLVGIVSLPFLTNIYILHIASLMGIFIIGAIGLNILSGNTGQISLGHGAFMAIGAYTTAIVSTTINLPFIVLIPLAGLITGIIGTVIALPALRLKGLYLAMVTFAFYYIVEFVLFNWESLTNGSSGIAVNQAAIGTWIIAGEMQHYYLIMFFAVIGIFFAVNIGRSKIGRAFGAVRDRDIAAEIIGISLTKYKIQAYFISSFYAGVAGSLYGIYLGFISPEHFPFMLSIQFLAMILIGGKGSVTGSIFGAIFLVIMPEVLKLIAGLLRNEYPVLSQQFGDVQTMFYGLIIIITLIFAPKGLFGLWDDIRTYIRRWPFSY
jgi:branched-chain amino acid transport system permease protein